MEIGRDNLKITDLKTGQTYTGETISYIDFNNEELGIYSGTAGYDDSDGVIDLSNCKIELIED